MTAGGGAEARPFRNLGSQQSSASDEVERDPDPFHRFEDGFAIVREFSPMPPQKHS